MPSHKKSVLGTYPAKGHGGLDSKQGGFLITKSGGSEQATFVSESDESGVEQRVKMGGEEEAVEDIQPLGVGFAIRPGFRVARPQEFGDGHAGERAGSAPVFQQGLAVEILADALLHEAQRFGAVETGGFQLGNLLRVAISGMVREGHCEFRRSAEQTTKGRFAMGQKA